MKRHFLLLSMLSVIALIFTACSKDDDSSKGTHITAGDIEMPALKGGSSLLITHYAEMTPGNRAINYRVEWDTEKRSQRWTCYKMYRSINGGSSSRTSSTYPNDPELPSQYHIKNDPYWGTGYDHGHICPNADRKSSYEANYQTFYLTNMQPQGGKNKNDFNGGIWATMEGKVRSWAAKFDTLYVCKGGTIDSEANIIEYIGSGDSRIPVPRYFFMAIVGRYKDSFRATGLWINQEAFYSNSVQSYSVTIGELQGLTGIDFFHNLPDDIESQIENVDKAQMLYEWY